MLFALDKNVSRTGRRSALNNAISPRQIARIGNARHKLAPAPHKRPIRAREFKRTVLGAIVAPVAVFEAPIAFDILPANIAREERGEFAVSFFVYEVLYAAVHTLVRTLRRIYAQIALLIETAKLEIRAI